mmetsp:Transcript_24436/g.39955  ORF Transcript_24436/g.39955 Transcript_24436/m.39955 type:complete len:99 (-) Transcript_24436:360-656(-)
MIHGDPIKSLQGGKKYAVHGAFFALSVRLDRNRTCSHWQQWPNPAGPTLLLPEVLVFRTSNVTGPLPVSRSFLILQEEQEEKQKNASLVVSPEPRPLK